MNFLNNGKDKKDLRKELIVAFAKSHGWGLVQNDDNQLMMAFKKHFPYSDVRMNIWYTKMTIGTYLFHPGSKKHTQMFRRNINWNELNQLLINPRSHTLKGYN